MRLAVAIFVTISLSGCVAGEALMQETTRSLARGAVNGAVNQYLPGVNAAPYTDCVINNATTAELVQLAQVAAAGTQGASQVASGAWPLVQTVVARPATQQCLLTAVTNSPLSQILGGAR